jgi:hypothetical protein
MRSGRRSAAVGYGLSIVISAVVTLLTIPVIVSRASADAWASLTLGQAVGTGAALLIGFGWGATGPTLIAQADRAERIRIYSESFRARALLLPVGLVAVAVIVGLGATAAPVPSVLNGFAYALTGMLAGWFFTGEGSPFAFLLLDALPRVLGNAIGTILVLFGLPLWTFSVAQLIGIAIGVLMSNRRIFTGHPDAVRGTVSGAVRALRGQVHGFVLASVLAINAAFPAAVVSFVVPGALPTYALADKLLRFGTTAYAPVIQFLQGWVPSDAHSVLARARRATTFGVVVSVAGAIAFVVLAPPIGDVLGRGEVQLELSTVVCFGLVLFAMELSQFVGLVALQALGQARKLSAYALFGMAVLCPAVVVGAVIGGANGAALGLLAGELASLLPQIWALRATARRLSGVTD